jgi:hypothetical protein
MGSTTPPPHWGENKCKNVFHVQFDILLPLMESRVSCFAETFFLRTRFERKGG